MSKNESSRKPKLSAVLLAAALSASALAGCSTAESAPKPTIPAAEQARMDADRAAEVRALEALNIKNSPISTEVFEDTISLAEKTKATYDSVKAYIEYAEAHDLPLLYDWYSYQTGDSTSCRLEHNKLNNIIIEVDENWHTLGTAHRTYMTLTPDNIFYSVKVNEGGKEGPVYKDGTVTNSQLSGVILSIRAVQDSTLENTYCAEAMYLADLLTDRLPGSGQVPSGGGGASNA